MTQDVKSAEIAFLRTTIPNYRASLHGETFATEPNRFKVLEGAKVRLSWLLGNRPDYSAQPRRRRRGKGARASK